jgi:hypothetical protein
MYVFVPLPHAQVPPHPSDRPPLLPSAGHCGAQHRPLEQFVPALQPQVPPQPSLPPQLPSIGHCGLQQAPS